METNLLKYRAFTEIGEGKSFTEASEILRVSQSGGYRSPASAG